MCGLFPVALPQYSSVHYTHNVHIVQLNIFITFLAYQYFGGKYLAKNDQNGKRFRELYRKNRER